MQEYPQYRLTAEQIRWADKLATRRSGSMGHKNTALSSNPTMGSLARHKVGARAEVVYSRYSDQKVDTWTIGIGDTGTDFEDGAQVKGSDIKNKPNLLIPVEHWPRKPPKFYVLVWLQNERFDRHTSVILGSIPREKADKVKYIVPEGEKKCYCDTYWVERHHLTPMPVKHQFADRPYPEPKPGNCTACEAMGGWKPYTNESMYCFHSAYYLKEAAEPIICIEAVTDCPRKEA